MNNPTSLEQARSLAGMIHNLVISRDELYSRMIDTRRDFNKEFGYPRNYSKDQFRGLYDRQGVGHRVVKVFPDACWAMDPEVFDVNDMVVSPFEAKVRKVVKKMNLWAMCHRADYISGIGQFGLLLIGFSDGRPLNEPIGESVAELGEMEVLYLRTFDESLITIVQSEGDLTNPRFGLPVMYSIQFVDTKAGVPITGQQNTAILRQVHWTRVIHLADNRISSEVHGNSALLPVADRIADLQKIYGGSGEMFWRSALPGISFETTSKDASLEDTQIDKEALRKQYAAYVNGLDRLIATVGLSAKQLAPIVADPRYHVAVQLESICITIGVPMRIFLGSEAGQLASGQDARSWNMRVAHRQNKYLTPFVIIPVIQRLIDVGVLPVPADEEFDVHWPDLNAPTDQDKATTAGLYTTALAAYVAGNCEAYMPFKEYLTIVWKMTVPEAEAAIKAAESQGGLKLGKEMFDKANAPPPAAGNPDKKGSNADSPKTNVRGQKK